MAQIPCFLCSHKLRLKKDKNGKRYCICHGCGVQIFVRGERGIANLAQLIKTLREREFPFRKHSRVLYEIQAVLTEIRGLEEELEHLDGFFEVFASKRHKKDQERAREALNARIDKLLLQLDQIANETR